MADEPLDNESLDDAWAEALAEANPEQYGDNDQQDQEVSSDEDSSKKSDDQSKTADFEEFPKKSQAMEEKASNLDFLLDIPLEVTVELGRTNMIVDKVLQLNQGSIIELSKEAGDTVDIYINNKILGKGEVIVVNERFGIRITEIISQADRVKTLGHE
ncbi:MAG: flagellar motor switch protein FliN [Desulfurivibrionaceae bacterium]